MPFINTNRPDLHQQLKIRAAQMGTTIGKIVDKYTEVGLTFKIENLTEDQITVLKETMQQKGASNLFELIQQ